MYYDRKVSQRRQLTYLELQNINDRLFAKSGLKRTRTPTWTTFLLDYAIKVVHFGEWVQIVTSYFAKITENGFAMRGGKDCLLMHAFSIVLPLFAFLSSFSLFLFSLLFPFQFSLFLALVVPPSLFMAIVPLYTKLILCDFPLLPLLRTNHFFLL